MSEHFKTLCTALLLGVICGVVGAAGAYAIAGSFEKVIDEALFFGLIGLSCGLLTGKNGLFKQRQQSPEESK